MFKINLTNYSDKWTLGKTHKQPRPMFPIIAGNMLVCLHGGGLWARLQLNTALWTLAQSKQWRRGSTEGNTAGQKQVWKTKLIENRHRSSEQQGGGDGWERGLKSTVGDHLRKEPHRILSDLMWREGCFMFSEKQMAHFEDLMRQKWSRLRLSLCIKIRLPSVARGEWDLHLHQRWSRSCSLSERLCAAVCRRCFCWPLLFSRLF